MTELVRVRDHVFIGPERFRVVSVNQDGVILKSQMNGRPKSLDRETMAEWQRSGRLVLPAVREASIKIARLQQLERAFTDFSAKLRRRAIVIHAHVRALDEIPTGRRDKELRTVLRDLAKDLGLDKPLGPRTVYRWWSIWIAHGREPQALVPLATRRGNRTSRMHPTAKQLVVEAVNECLTMEKPPLHEAFRAVAAQIERHNDEHDAAVPCPSVQAIYREFWSRDGFEVVSRREGHARARHLYKVVNPGPKARFLNEIWEVDHTRADLWLYDEVTNLLMGRPWITAVIDRFTRMIVGFHIGFDPPSFAVCMLALRHAIMPKTYLQELYPEIRFPYPAEGRPHIVRTDQGSDLTSEAFRETMFGLGITLDINPAGQPWYKGCIERWFLTMRLRLLQRIPGNVAGANARNPDYRPEEVACIGYAEFVALFHRWLIEDYHQSLHAGIRMPPAMAWELAYARQAEEFWRPAPSPATVEPLMGMLVNGTPQRYGLKWKGLIWQSSAFATIRSVAGIRTMVSFRVDPMNLLEIRFHNPVSDRWETAMSTEPDYTKGLTLHQHEVISRYTRQTVAEYSGITVKDLMKSRREISATIASGKPASAVGRMRTIRYLTLARDGMGGRILDLHESIGCEVEKAGSARPDEEFPAITYPDLEALESEATLSLRPAFVAPDPTRRKR